MFINGVPDCDQQGKEIKTGLVAAKAIRDGELRTTNSGKEVGSVSVRAYSRKDGSAAFLTVKGWGRLARQLSAIQKDEPILAAGRLETREYNGKTYTDLTADFVLSVGSAPADVSAPSPADQGFIPIEDDGELPF